MAPYQEALRLDSLELIEKRLQHATKQTGFVQIQAQLNNVEQAVQDSDPLIRAHFYLASAALRIKAVSLGEHQWLRAEPCDILQQALELLARAQAACEAAVEEVGGWTVRLSAFQRSCAYESCVATSYLRVHGAQPDIIFDTSRLDAKQRRNYQNALRHRYILHSSF